MKIEQVIYQDEHGVIVHGNDKMSFDTYRLSTNYLEAQCS